MTQSDKDKLREELFDRFAEMHDGGIDAGEFATWIEGSPSKVWDWISEKLEEAERRGTEKTIEFMEEVAEGCLPNR